MGGTSSSTENSSQTSQLTPWAPAASGLQGILSGLAPSIANLNGGPGVTSALSALAGIAGQPNPLGASSINAANTQLGGAGNYGAVTGILNDAYGKGSAALSPFTSGSALDPSSNPALAQELNVAQQGAVNTVNPLFAAAGRYGSPANSQALGRGIVQAETPILENAANRQITAAGGLGNLASGTASGLTGADVANSGILGQGINNASTAYGNQTLGPQLALQAALTGSELPIQNAQSLSGILGSLGGMFGQQTGSGTKTGTQTMSPIQQALAFSQMFGNIFGGNGGSSAAGNASKLIFG